MNIPETKSVLAAMRSMKLKARDVTASVSDGAGAGFADIFKQQLENINIAHKEVDILQEKFILGEDVSLAEIKTAELKASIYTQGLIHVRNELVKAYNEIMNMTV